MNENALCPGLGDYLIAQARNNHWSNHRLHSACLRLPASEYYANRPSFFGSIHIHLDHIVFVDWLYLERLTGEQYLPADVGDELHNELAPLVEDQVTADRALIEYCDAATPEILASEVSFKLWTVHSTRRLSGPCLRICSRTRFIIVVRCTICSRQHQWRRRSLTSFSSAPICRFVRPS